MQRNITHPWFQGQLVVTQAHSFTLVPPTTMHLTAARRAASLAIAVEPFKPIHALHALPSRYSTNRRLACAAGQQQTGAVQQDEPSSNTTTEAAPSQVASISSSPSASSAAGLLSAPEQQAAALGALAVSSLVFGAVALVVPGQLVSTALGVQATELDVAFTRIAGATMAISAAVEYSLQDAVKAGHLKSATYQRLLVGVIAKSSLYLAAFMLSPELWNPVLAAFYPTAAAASVAVASLTLQSAFQQAGAASVSEGLQGIWGFSSPKTAASWGYSVAIVLYVATVAACYAPEVIFTGQAMTQAGLLLKHTWGPGFLLAAMACYVLKDAADRSRLGASTFVRLNQGLAAVEAGYSAVFAAAILSGLAVADGSAYSNLAGSLALVAFCGYQAVANKK